MKWLVVVLCLARHAESNAIRCTSGSDASCATEDTEKVPETPIQLSEEGGKETVKADAECLSGTQWDSNCHSCSCADNGIAVCTPKQECFQQVFAEPLRCKPNTTFVRDCNTCTCLDSGFGLCTLKSCTSSNVQKKPSLVTGRECAAGTRWSSQCNRCHCTPDGHSACTDAACTGYESEPVLRCAPASMWMNECNSCWCTTDGLAICTRMGCNIEAPQDLISGNTKKNFEESRVKEKDGDFSIEYEEETKLSDFVGKEKSEKEFEMVDNVKSKLKNVDHSIEDIDVHNIKSDHELDKESEIEQNSNLQQTNSVLIETNDEFHNVLKRSVCKANEAFQSECNTCKCSADGQSFTCSHNECMEGEKNKEVEVFMENEGEDHIERHSVCKPLGTFYIGCNTCHCNNYGTDYSCTNKPCPLPEDVELFHELRASKTSKNKTQRVVCVANRMFIKDCNTCWCNEDGTSFFCTRKVCIPDFPDEGVDGDKPEELRVIKKECRPDEVFEIDCNMCRCNPDGKSYSCTRRACADQQDEDDIKNSTLIRKTRGVNAQDTPKTCQPGQEFRMDCNKCLCDNEGQDFSCTRHDCNALNGNGAGTRTRRDTSETIPLECNPGSVFDRECNVCRCTEDGAHALCTLRRCTQTTQHSNDVDTNLPESDPNFRCNPGEQFKRGCNDCSCSADGKSVFCTLRLCDQDVTPPPSL